MCTEESLIADAQADRIRESLILDGWQECDLDCGEIYAPDPKLTRIGNLNVCDGCLAEYGLVKVDVVKEIVKMLRVAHRVAHNSIEKERPDFVIPNLLWDAIQKAEAAYV